MIVVALLLFIIGANARPEGAPTTVCQTMVPFHGNGIVRQQGPSPYSIKTLRNQGDVVVTIKSSIEIPLQGLMLQARIRDGELAGAFETSNSDVHAIDCIQAGDTITHSHPRSKPAVEVRWKPPLGYVGPVTFNATVAQDYSTFWVGVESETLRLSKRFQDDEAIEEVPSRAKAATSPHYTPEETTGLNVKADSFYQGCGVGKLCFGNVDGCVDTQDCRAVVAITVSGDRYQFEMKAVRSPGWVGVGLSTDNQMGEDSVIECSKDNSGMVKAYLAWTDPRPDLNALRIANNQNGITLQSSSADDDTIYCNVLRDAKTTINGVEFDLINTPYYILIAAGSDVRVNGPGYHDIGRLASDSSRYLSDISAVMGASKILLRLHGAFMLAAWIGTASLGTFIARYYRKTWVGKTICGKDLWFAWHRCLMVLTWALTTVAFILIFVELKAWSTENPHSILGCIVTALCFMQPIGAFFRPHPGTPKRPIFNWMHWLGGNAAHIIAIIAIFFAVRLTKAELPQWFDWILVAFVAFHVLMHLVLSILSCVADNSSNQRITAFPMKDLNTSGKMSAHMVNVDAPYSGARKLLLALYFIVVVGLTAGLIVVAVLAPIGET